MSNIYCNKSMIVENISQEFKLKKTDETIN